MVAESQKWRINKVFVSCEEADVGNTASYQNALTEQVVQAFETALKKQASPITLLLDQYPMERYPLVERLLSVLPRVANIEYRNHWVPTEVLQKSINRGILQRFSCTFSKEILDILPQILEMKHFKRLAVRKNPAQEEDWATFEEILQISDMDVQLGDEIIASRP
uniref:FTH domain-containing protein n=1 Tax=Steinernema glaseri TaxID=37863 RepID=A0A1I7YTU1_9BILA